MKRKSRYIFSLSFFVLGLVLSLSFFCVFKSLSKTKSVNSQFENIVPSFSIYFLSVNSCVSENEAHSLAEDLFAEDFAGFVWQNNDKFEIIVSAYKNENDATLVKNKLKSEGFNVEIFVDSFPEFNITSTYSDSEQKILLEALTSFSQTFDNLYDISISLDNNLINEISAKLELNRAITNFNKTKSDFDTVFFQNDDFLNTISSHLFQCQQTLNNLTNDERLSSKQTFSSLIKYKYTDILSINKNLLNELKT